jgi:TRAP transporter TAXI family solute receptor
MLSISLPENITVVIEMGGTKNWRALNIDPEANSRYVFDSDGLRLVEKLPQAAMNDKNTVENFLRFCNDNYPADHRGVIFWNHGGGSVNGVIFDEYTGKSLRLPGLRAAFEAVCTPSIDAPPYEFVGFDACLMSTIDVAEMLNGIAYWMVGSQGYEPSCGWSYSGFMQMLADNTGMNGGRLGKAICDTFYAKCVKNNVAADVSLSLIDLSYIDGLVEEYEKIGVELFSKVCQDQKNFGLLERVALKTENYGNNEWDGYTNMADLGDFVRKAENAGLIEKDTSPLYNALYDCVTYQVKGRLMSDSHGLSFYYNYNGDKNDFDRFAALKEDHPFRWLYHYRLYQEMPDDGRIYMKTLAAQHGYAQLDAPPIERLSMGLEKAAIRLFIEGDRHIAELEIGSQEAALLASVRVNLMQLDENGPGMMIFDTEYISNYNWENGLLYDYDSFDGKWPAIDGVFIYMELKKTVDHDTLYNVPVLLNGELYTLCVSYLHKTGEYKILGTRCILNGNGMASKDLRNLVPGDIVEPLYLFEDSAGIRSRKPSGTVTYSQDTRIKKQKLPEGMFYFAFTMTDLYGNEHTTNAVKVVLEREDYAIESRSTLIMGTGGSSGTYYPYAQAMAKTLMNHIDGLDISAIITDASQANIYAISNNTIDIALAQNDVMDYAVRGTSLFIESVGGFYAIAGLYPEVCQIIARPGIKTVADLRGKNVSIGNVGSGTPFNAVQILTAYDMAVMDIKVFYLDFSHSVAALMDGSIDAFFCVAGVPTTAISELALSHKIVLLEIDDEHANKLIEKHTFYTPFEIGGGKYRGVDKTVQTVAVKAALVVSEDFSADLAYDITRVLFESKNEIAAAHAMGTYLDAASAIEEITVPFHPGAERFYREIGVLK